MNTEMEWSLVKTQVGVEIEAQVKFDVLKDVGRIYAQVGNQAWEILITIWSFFGEEIGV